MPSVYVGTYSKYNRGSIGGAWLDLEDYGDKDEFMKACQELHADEYDPEFMFQNYEGIPSQFITECSVKAEFWDYMYSTVNEEVKAAYMELFGEWNLMTWAKWFEATKDRHVADEKIGDVRVSTVFFGVDHSFGGGPPMLFETMVFGGSLDQEQDRCTTWDEAEAMHKAVVERVKGANV